MKTLKTNFLVVFVVVNLIGCGYFNAGTWQDDPKNWERAFHQKTPQGIEIMHSYYWRSPHWTYEFRYFFSIRGTKETRDLLFANGQLKKFDQNSGSNFQLDNSFDNKPSWFLPKVLDQCEVWIFKDEPRGNFRLFIDKISGDIFITDFQI